MENLRKRVDVKLVRSQEEDKLRRLIASPAFAWANIFDADLAAIQVHKSRLVLNRPVYVDSNILDLSKHLMYDFYYNQLKAQYEESCQLLYTDTDSLLIEIETEDVYKDMAQKQDLYDTSVYPQDHPIAEYVGLRPTMYSILEASGKTHVEGVSRKKECREEAHQARAVQRGPLRKANLPPRYGYPAVRAPSHLRATTEQGISLTLRLQVLQALDRKNGVDTLAYGHRDAVPAGCQAGAGVDVYIEELFNA